MTVQEQTENIARVHHKIGPTVMTFFRLLGVGHEFHVDGLRRWIEKHHPHTAPDSAGRIMRDLRQNGLIDYTVVNRRASLYLITAIQQDKRQ